MKKALALVLAMMMILGCACALAENSKGNQDINQGTTNKANISMEKITADGKLAEVIDKITEAQKAGNALDGLPEDIKAKIPEENKTINEMVCYHLVGDTAGVKEFVMIFKFETPYKEGEKVTLLLGIAPADADVEWLVLEGVGNADGDVEVKVTEAELAKISNNPFVVIPVSK